MLSILEAQTSHAIKRGGYAASIKDLGYRDKIGSKGSIIVQAAYDADWDSDIRKDIDGYFLKVLELTDGPDGITPKNSYVIVGIPMKENLPLYLTAAIGIKRPEFPLINWWALRIYGKDRARLTKYIMNSSKITLSEIGIEVPPDPSLPQEGSDIIRRFQLDDAAHYPNVK